MGDILDEALTGQMFRIVEGGGGRRQGSKTICNMIFMFHGGDINGVSQVTGLTWTESGAPGGLFGTDWRRRVRGVRCCR